jgi:hypothetical protein
MFSLFVFYGFKMNVNVLNTIFNFYQYFEISSKLEKFTCLEDILFVSLRGSIQYSKEETCGPARKSKP